MRAIALMMLLAAPAAAQPGLTLEGLLSRFAHLQGIEARFHEEKHIALLAAPIVSDGRIYFAPPQRLLRRVTSPEPSVALIADGQLQMRQGDHVERISIGDNPVLRGFIDSFRAVLAGDRAALERFYEVRLVPQPERGPEAWQLTLLPRDAALRRLLQRIEMQGEGVIVHEMRMLEENGDETRTTFSEVHSDRAWTPAEIAQTFRLE